MSLETKGSATTRKVLSLERRLHRRGADGEGELTRTVKWGYEFHGVVSFIESFKQQLKQLQLNRIRRRTHY